MSMRLPTYERQVTGLNPVQGAKLDTAAPSPLAAVASGMQQATKEYGEVLKREREIADHQKLTEKQTDLQTNLNGLLEHVSSVKDPRNPAEWGGKEGQSLSAWFEEQAKALYTGQAAGLSKEQLAKFDSSVLPAMTSMAHHVTTNEMALIDKKHHETYLAAVGSAQQLAARTLFDGTGRFSPLAATLGSEKTKELVAAEAKRNGWDANRTQLEMVKQLTPMHTSVISQLAKTNPLEAEKYFHENRDTISTEDQGRLAEAVRIGAEYSKGDTVYGELSQGLTAANYEERLKTLYSRTDLQPATRDHVKVMLQNVIHGQEMKKKEQITAAVDAVSAVYNQRGPWAAMSSREFQLLRTADESTAANLKHGFAAEARALRNETSPEDELNSMFKYGELINSDGFLNMTKDQLEQGMVGMTQKHKLSVAAVWTDAKSSPKVFQANRSMMLKALHDANLIKFADKLQDKDQKEHDAFGQLNETLRLLNADRGNRKPMTEEQQKAAIDEAVRSIVIGKGWFNTDKTETTFSISSRLQSQKFDPVRAQILQAYQNPNMTVLEQAQIYGSALAAGKVRKDGFIDPEFLPRTKYAKDPTKAANWRVPGLVVPDAVGKLRKMTEEAK